ncbi:MAG: Zn-ribbon domain-containing OB-fold protein [Candidatus Thermoplasmatota archaeon]|nr:Zn-ribbon domain-containing OB-fold protein [Candidatus Thermoplasmatota archaeon]
MAIPRFWRETPSRYNLFASKCGNCGEVHFPPRFVCPSCHRKSIGRMESIKLCGTGKILSYSVVHDAPEDFEMQKPYIIAIIEMKDGVRLTAPIIDCDEPDIGIGMEVEATFRKLGEEGKAGVIHYGYKFRRMNRTPPEK